MTMTGEAHRGGSGLSADRSSVITSRQREVLRLAALGYSYEETAARLNISRDTVKNHHARIHQAAHGRCLADALRFVGWLKVP